MADNNVFSDTLSPLLLNFSDEESLLFDSIPLQIPLSPSSTQENSFLNEILAPSQSQLPSPITLPIPSSPTPISPPLALPVTEIMLHNQQLPQQHQQPTTVQPTQTPLLHSDPQQSRQKAQNRKQNLVFHSYDTTKGKKRGVIDVEREVEEVRREPLSSDLSEEGKREVLRRNEQQRRDQISTLVSEMECLLVGDELLNQPEVKMLAAMPLEQPQTHKKGKRSIAKILKAAKTQLLIFNKAIRFYTTPKELHSTNISGFILNNTPIPQHFSNMDKCYASDVQLCYTGFPSVRDIAEVKKLAHSFSGSIQNLTLQITKIETVGTMMSGSAYVHVIFSGTYQDSFGYKQVYHTGIHVYQIKSAKIVDVQLYHQASTPQFNSRIVFPIFTQYGLTPDEDWGIPAIETQ